MKIINFGSLNIDIFFRVNHIVKPGETISAQSIEKRAGGKGLNQSIALVKNFDKVYHAGSVGSDGAFLKEYLKGEGIDTSFIKESKNPTGNAIIQVDDKGENSIVLYKGANFDNDKEYIAQVLSKFDKDDILAYNVEAVDSTGAGDTFTGFFVAEFYKNKDVKDCLKLATKASALSVTKQGASISIPNIEEVKKFDEEDL